MIEFVTKLITSLYFLGKNESSTHVSISNYDNRLFFIRSFPQKG